MTEPPSLLVIGYGNSLRRDDGAGLLLAERLAACWLEAGIAVRLILTQQLMPELAEKIASASATHVVFVDARVADHATAAVQIELISPARDLHQSLGHQMDPGLLLAYAEHLYDGTPACCVVTISGFDFGFGDQLSDGVRQLLDNSGEIAERTLSGFDLGKAPSRT